MDDEPKILVVEDDTAIADMVRGVLRRQSWHATIVHTGEAALPLMQPDAFDVMLLDKNLPGIGGLELLERAKGTDPNVEVIIMTAHADMRSVLKALGAGVYDYLVKPFGTIDEVIHTLTRALERRHMRLENQRLIADLTKANANLHLINENLEEMVEERTRQLERLSQTDDVTGLYNQRFLHRRIDEEHHRALRYERDLAVLMLDIDFFKAVNDTNDHIFGSAVLRRVGGLLRENVREVDLVIRYGGDEFVVILPETETAGAAIAAERLRAAIEHANVGQDDVPCKVTISMGIAALDACEVGSPQALLQAADRALYAAKAGGRNCVYSMRGEEPERVAPRQ